MSQTLTPILTLDDWVESYISQSERGIANKLDIMRYLNYDVGQDATLAEVDAALWRLHEAGSIQACRGIWEYGTRKIRPSKWSGPGWGEGEEGRRRKLAFRASHFPTKTKTDHSDLEVEDWILTLLRAHEATRSRKNPEGTLLTSFGTGVSATSLMSAIQYQAGHDVTIAEFDSAVENLVEHGKIESMNPNNNCWRILLLDDSAQEKAFRIEDVPVIDDI